MKVREADWYKKIWSMDIVGMSWVEDTKNQVDFIVRTLGLTGEERILDLACGFGRHSLELARRGYRVTGVDITGPYVEHAAREARREGVPAEFFCRDIRDVRFREEFDVALSLADGAIGYLEDDGENLKIFDVISRALRPGGKHFMDVCSAEHAERCFPKRWWEAGERELSLAVFEWDGESRRMHCGGWQVPYGEPAVKPGEIKADPIRLYSRAELRDIFAARDMEMVETFSDYRGKKASPLELQLLAYSRKKGPCGAGESAGIAE